MPMAIGPVVAYPFEHIPQITDWVSGKTLTICGAVLPFSYETLEALCKLNPYERWNLLILAKNGWGTVSTQKPKHVPDYSMSHQDYVNLVSPHAAR